MSHVNYTMTRLLNPSKKVLSSTKTIKIKLFVTEVKPWYHHFQELAKPDVKGNIPIKLLGIRLKF